MNDENIYSELLENDEFPEFNEFPGDYRDYEFLEDDEFSEDDEFPENDEFAKDDDFLRMILLFITRPVIYRLVLVVELFLHWVWKYFKLSKDKQYDVCDVEVMNLKNQKVKCGYKYLHNGSTGNMSSHLQNKHNLCENKNKNQDRTVQQTLSETFERTKTKPDREPRNQEIQQAIAEWIIVDNLPINIINGKGYRKMMKIVDPVFQVPSNKRIKKIINDSYPMAVENLKKLINDTCESASLTTDLWTAQSKHRYI
ncbi:15424_t:CDS:2, partial [Dentiscutata heterogama]